MHYWNVEWLNANSQRAYPLAEDAIATDESGDFQLPTNFLVGLYLPVHAGLDIEPDRFFLRSVAAWGTGYRVYIGYDDGTDDPPIAASAVIPRATHTEYNTYVLIGEDDFEEIQGQLAIGLLESIDQQPAGQFFFTADGGKLHTDCVKPQIRGVSSLAAINGAETSDKLRGTVRLVAGENIRLTVSNADTDTPEIRIDAIDGEGTVETCVCSEDDELPAIRTIGGVTATPEGGLTMVGNDCITIEALTNGLRIQDDCSEPCCGCTELETITTDLAQFGDQVRTLTNFINRIETQQGAFRDTVLASVLGDSGCGCS